MIRACLCLLAGIYALQLSSFAPYSDLIVIVLFAFLALLVPGSLRALLLLLAGSLIFVLAANRISNSRISVDYVGDSIVMQVRITDFPKRSGASVSFIATTIGNSKLPRRLRISWFEPPVDLRLGDVWQLELRLRRPRGSSNPGVFDYEAWLFRERIGAVGYVAAGRRNQLLRVAELKPVGRVRQHVVDRLTKLIPNAERAAALVAISVGARHLLTPEQWDRYARTGTSHLMAISGLHVGMAATATYFVALALVGLFSRQANQHVIAIQVAAATATVYALLSGLAVPAQRASLMIILLAIAAQRRRIVQPLIIVAAASLIIALASPVATMAPGFKLSFTAVMVLIWFGIRYSRGDDTSRMMRIQRAIRQLASMQLLLLLGLLPLTVLIFGRIAFAAPAVNLLAVPVFSIATVPLTLAGLILDGVAQPLGDRALLLAAASLGAIEALIAVAADAPAASATIPAIGGRAWLYVLVPAVWAVFPPAWPTRSIAWLATAALLLHSPPRTPTGCADIDVLDVGQGLSVVVSSHNHVLVYDTGPSFRGGGSAVASVLLPYLNSRGIDTVDTLLVSHGDLDHAGGVADLLAGAEVLHTRAGEPLPIGHYELCSAGDSWRVDEIEFRILHPPAEHAREGNDSSCVLLVSAGSSRVLLSGDIEQPAERQLLLSGRLQPVDVVIVPHHGSRTSSSTPFVQALRPSVAIVSAGYGNRWGFPKAEVVARWHAVGAEVHTTAAAGAISVRLCQDRGVVSLSANRALQRRIWHE